MLEVDYGAPGAGKTFGAMKHRIIPAAREKRLVITNVPINWDKLDAFFPGSSWFVKVHDTRDGWGWWQQALCNWRTCEEFAWRNPLVPGQGPLVVIDEARDLIHASNRVLPDGAESFFSQHRHMGLDIVLLTQNVTDLYMPVRKLAAKTWKIRNLSVIGMKGRYWRTCYDGWAMRQQIGGVEWGRYTKDIFECYDSHTAGGGAFDRKEKPAWRSGKTKFLVSLMVLLVLWLMFHPVKMPGGHAGGGQASLPSVPPTDTGGPVSAVSPFGDRLGGGGERTPPDPEVEKLQRHVMRQVARQQADQLAGGFGVDDDEVKVAPFAREWLYIGGALSVEGGDDTHYIVAVDRASGRKRVLDPQRLWAEGWTLMRDKATGNHMLVKVSQVPGEPSQIVRVADHG